MLRPLRHSNATSTHTASGDDRPLPPFWTSAYTCTCIMSILLIPRAAGPQVSKRPPAEESVGMHVALKHKVLVPEVLVVYSSPFSWATTAVRC